ncbi:MAG TPA: FUSC family protein [Candidatus Baltobacteraceae bacterium]|nr:FUSC family protein [Candidatus Baltobacteraceae bacterium]
MGHIRSPILWRIKDQGLEHPARTAVAAAVSLVVAAAFKLPEAYWAPVSTIVVMQSTLGAAIKVSGQRFAGTALGAAAGALVATYLPGTALVFGVSVFAMGLVCAALWLDRAAYRFGGITLAIVLLVVHEHAAWIVALHRFIEVSIGIGVGLLITAVWPERNPPPSI